MDPSSDRSYHPSGDASYVSSRSRSRGRGGGGGGGFGEVKSPSVIGGGGGFGTGGCDASTYCADTYLGVESKSGTRNSRGNFDVRTVNTDDYGNGGNGGGGSSGERRGSEGKKSLEEYVRNKNATARSRAPYEMDIQSFDKDQPTWASRDWNEEAIRARRFLREAKAQENGDGIWRDENQRQDRRGGNSYPQTPYSNQGDDGRGGRQRQQERQAPYNDQGDDGNTCANSTIFDKRWNEAMNSANERALVPVSPQPRDGGYDPSVARYGHKDSRDSHSRYSDERSQNLSRGRPRDDPRTPGNDEYNRRNSRDNHSRYSDERSRSQGRPSQGPRTPGGDYGRRGSQPSQTARTPGGDDYGRRDSQDNHSRYSGDRSRSQGRSRDGPHGPPNNYDDRSNYDGIDRRGSSRGRPAHQQVGRQPYDTPQDGGYYDKSNDDGYHRIPRRESQNTPGGNNPVQQRGRQMDGPASTSRTNSIGRARSKSAHRHPQPQEQKHQPQSRAGGRSQSRGNPNTRSDRSRTPGPSGDKSVRSGATTSTGRQRSRSINRPTKKLGCLGGSSDMTRRRSATPGNKSGGPRTPRDPSVYGGDDPTAMQESMQDYEREMKDRRKNSHRRDSPPDDYSPRNSLRNSATSEKGGGSGRSQSRGGQRGQTPGGQSRHGGRRSQTPGGQGPRDPSCGRSKSRSRGGSTPGPPQADGRPQRRRSRSKTPGPAPVKGRSLSRGKNAAPKSDATLDSRRSRSSKKSGRGRSKSVDKRKDSKSKATGKSVLSDYSSSTSSTPETGPLTDHSGKSSRGNFLKKGMPPSTPPQMDDDSRPATPNRAPSVNGDESTVATSRNGEEEEIVTYLFDRKGYCVRHPHVRLRKKKLLGGWNVLITNCPDCCVEEMGRLKRVRKRVRDKNKKKVEKEKKGPRGVPDLKEQGRSRSRGGNEQPQGRSRSRSRGRGRSQPPPPEVKGGQRSNGRGRSKSKDRRPSNLGRQEPLQPSGNPVFEFDIPLDAHGDVRQSGGRSVKSGKSRSKSVSSRKSSRSNRTNKSSRSNKTNKSSKSNKTGSSKRGRGRAWSRSKSRGRDDPGAGETVVSRGSHQGSAQRFIRQGPNLRVAKMPFTDKYGRAGKYTGEINEYGAPNGKGTLRYTNGTVYDGMWRDGHSEDMDANMERARDGGFTGNWKENTKNAKMERERMKEREMDDLRSFISQSVRSGAGGSVGGGSQQGSSFMTRPNPNNGNQRQGSAGRVDDMPWSDVNGFSGHYTGEVNSQDVPDGRGSMRYSNGVTEEGTFCNGVFQPPSGPQPPNDDGYGDEGGDVGVPSSSMSVWSLKSSPTMAFAQGGHNVLTGNHGQGGGGGASSVMGAPTSVHLGGPSGGGLYGNVDRRY